MRTNLSLNSDLVEEARQYLIENHDAPKLKSQLRPESIVSRILSLFLYGVQDYNKGQQLLKQKLQELGASEDDYVKGRVRTWARTELLNKSEEHQEEERRFSTKLDQTLREVIQEEYIEEESIYEGKTLVRETPEEIEVKRLPETPPWEGISKLEWGKVYQLYPNYPENPFVKWAKDNEGNWDKLRVEAVKVGLAHTPPGDRTSPDTWKLIRELYEQFKEWEGRENK